jgi:predicted nucleic acid-binding protein
VSFILGTNALSAIAIGEHKAVKEFTRADEVAIPVIVLGEHRFGISHSRHKDEYERWLAKMVAVRRDSR